ncbi:hypothetical protein [Listeria grandensis]|uniref:hypothetical protein n=1 Tax=Listeria grandensis TaxID=1494963 RepID=UPI00164D6B3F|nr:hypothetical protein [Listeria grandensis]MBC6316745.1 hypothetical protein [Listeria grandensis]
MLKRLLAQKKIAYTLGIIFMIGVVLSALMADKETLKGFLYNLGGNIFFLSIELAFVVIIFDTLISEYEAKAEFEKELKTYYLIVGSRHKHFVRRLKYSVAGLLLTQQFSESEIDEKFKDIATNLDKYVNVDFLERIDSIPILNPDLSTSEVKQNILAKGWRFGDTVRLDIHQYIDRYLKYIPLVVDQHISNIEVIVQEDMLFSTTIPEIYRVSVGSQPVLDIADNLDDFKEKLNKIINSIEALDQKMK